MTDKDQQNSDARVHARDGVLSFPTLQTGAVPPESKTAGTAEAGDDEVRILLERAIRDLAGGWPAAAYDCLGRAMRLLEERMAAEVPR